MLRRNSPVMKSVESVLRPEGSLRWERFVKVLKGVVYMMKKVIVRTHTHAADRLLYLATKVSVTML